MTAYNMSYVLLLLLLAVIDPANHMLNQLLNQGSQYYRAAVNQSQHLVNRPPPLSSKAPYKLPTLFASASEGEERLVKDLFKGYNRFIRPVEDQKQTLEIEMGLSLIQLININEKSQVMVTSVWRHFRWVDYQLRWEPALYGGIEKLRVPPHKIWNPDIVLFNNADGNYETRFKCNVLIHNNGTVVWMPPATLQSFCPIDVTYFPFDQQRCGLVFGSLTYTGNEIKMKFLNDSNYAALADYEPGGTWDLISVPACLQSREPTTLTSCSSGTSGGGAVSTQESRLIFFIIIKRKILFYTINLILPTVVLSYLSIVVFCMPPESGEKVTLGVTILVSLVVFILLVSKILPPSSVIPLLSKYILFTYVLNFITVIATVVILNIYSRGPNTHPMPNWVRLVFLESSHLSKLLCMKRPKKTRLSWMTDMHGSSGPSSRQQQQQQQQQQHAPAASIPSDVATSQLAADYTQQIGRNINHRRSSSRPAGGQLSQAAVEATEAIDFIAEHLKYQEEQAQMREDWRYVARTIDRLLLYLFALVISLGTSYIFLTVPHLFEAVEEHPLLPKIDSRRNFM